MLRTANKRLFVGNRLPAIFGEEPWRVRNRYIASVMADAPVAYWPLQDFSGLPADISGAALDMSSVAGSPVYSQLGKWSQPSILYPSGAAHSRSVVMTATTNLSIEMWVYRIGSTGGTLFSNGSGNGYQLAFNGSGGNVRPVLPGVGNLGNFAALVSDTWYHLVLTRGASSWIGYMNGVAQSSPGTASPVTPTTTTSFGGGTVASGCRLAHVALYTTELSSGRVFAHYTAALENTP